jgi:hypothetical protein
VSTPFNRLNEAGNELPPQAVLPSGICALAYDHTKGVEAPLLPSALSLDKPAKIPSPDTFGCALGNPPTYRAYLAGSVIAGNHAPTVTARQPRASFAQDEKGRGYFSKPGTETEVRLALSTSRCR